jgi:hypothetical protein
MVIASRIGTEILTVTLGDAMCRGEKGSIPKAGGHKGLLASSTSSLAPTG